MSKPVWEERWEPITGPWGTLFDAVVSVAVIGDEATANPERRQLASAAPDLYRELEKTIHCIGVMREWCLRQNDAKHATEFCHDVVFEAQKAMWKARGKT